MKKKKKVIQKAMKTKTLKKPLLIVLEIIFLIAIVNLKKTNKMYSVKLQFRIKRDRIQIKLFQILISKKTLQNKFWVC